MNLTGFDDEVAILDKRAAQELTSGFAWEAGVSSPGCPVENQKCILVITGNFQPDTLDSNGSFKLGTDQQVLYNQSMQFLCQTVPQAMAALGEISCEHVQDFMKPASLLTDSQCGLTPIRPRV